VFVCRAVAVGWWLIGCRAQNDTMLGAVLLSMGMATGVFVYQRASVRACEHVCTRARE